MTIQKKWAEGVGVFIYSDLSGNYKYADSITPYNYFQDIVDQLDQYSYRFFNDDGNESSATAKANLNTSPTLSANDIVRLRFLLNATGDLDSKLFKLECRYKPSGQSFGPWETVL
jgi:hypothetical protein